MYDSGIGGLTVLKALQKKFPHENFIYFADTANVPYGTKTEAQIIEYSHRIVDWMSNAMQVKAVVAACHTSSGIALEVLTPQFDVPVIGTMMPVVNAVRESTLHNALGVIATPASASRKTHEKILRAQGFQGTIVSIGCPEFVPLIEAGALSDPRLYAHAQEYLRPFHEQGLDTLVYGCTHYPLIEDVIKKALPSGVHHIDPANYIAADLYHYLHSHSLETDSLEAGKVDFYCSGPFADFMRKVGLFMGESFSQLLLEEVI